MDQFTILIMIVISSAIMTLTMVSDYIFDSSQKHTLDWAFAGAAFSVASTLAVFDQYHAMAQPTVTVFLNAFFIIGHALILKGCLRLMGHQSGYFAVVALSIIVVAIQFVPAVVASAQLRVLILSPVVIVINLAALTVLAKHLRSKEFRGLLPLILSVFMFLVLYILRFISMAQGDGGIEYIKEGFVYIGNFLLSSYYFLLTVSLIFTNFWFSEQKLKAMAVTDNLTGFFNRNALVPFVSKAYNFAKRENLRLAFIMIDVDHFKKVNDEYGHHVGDKVLQRISSVVTGYIREQDSVFRMGGEEFLLVALKTDCDGAIILAERLREAISQCTIAVSNEEEIQITVSIGISTNSSHDDNWQGAIERADYALYEAKHNGRNRVQMSSPSLCYGTVQSA
ncbi:diguanylate cyclase [Pseudoalteromonas sp. SSDWG2]|uniref:GGDEF domain-containing protein n=1 Tax=Pseudoalteromonas sp. SSDWG2 TaxID=3139391 RepID=UPI003BAD25D8